MDAQRLTVTATGLDPQGAGVGIVDGCELHVADLLPGERALVTIDHRSPHRDVAWAQVTRRLGLPSPHRVAPSCPAFGRCGGCAWQHLDLSAQLYAKRLRVLDAFEQAGRSAAPRSAGAALASVAVPEVTASPRQWGYRNKGKYVVAHHKPAGAARAKLVFGAYEPRSHTVVETLGCKVVAPVIDEVATWAAGAAQAAGLVPFVERTGAGDLRYLVARANRDGDVLVGLIVASHGSVAAMQPLAAALARHPAVRSVLALVNRRRDGSIAPAGAPVVRLVGDELLCDTVSGFPVAVGVGEFLQVNSEQADALYAAVAEMARAAQGVHAIDLYSGVGGIALAMAKAGARVGAVERNSDAAAALEKTARAAGLPVTVTAGDAESARALPAADVVVVNPPRKGLGPEAIATVVSLAPARIVYVSCGPETLARDLLDLTTHGYQVERVRLFDLMPGTAQVETVVALERGAASR